MNTSAQRLARACRLLVSTAKRPASAATAPTDATWVANPSRGRYCNLTTTTTRWRPHPATVDGVPSGPALSWLDDIPAELADAVPVVEVTRDQVDAYRRDGFLVLREFMTPAQLDTWRGVVDEAVADRGKQKFHVDTEDVTNVDFEYYDNVFTQRVNLWRSSDRLRLLLFAAAGQVARTAAELEGVPGIRLWHDQALYKEAWANPTSWHVDVPYWSFDSLHAISWWLALDDATQENGCLHFLPGSHKLLAQLPDPYQEIKIGKNQRDLFDIYPQLADSDAVSVPMAAGSCSFHNGLTVHAAGPNMTSGRRRAMTLQLMPDGDGHNVFNGKQNVLTEEEMAALEVGDRLQREDVNPTLWQRG